MGTARVWTLYLAALVPFLVIDLIWLGVVAKGLYRREMGDLIRQPINKTAALAFYLLYPLGLVIFVLPQALAPGGGGVSEAFIRGALLGMLAYGTYDLTNLATVRGFSTKIALIDWVWGTLLTGAVAAIAVSLLGFGRL
jgi:uncharacterized membrane protein